MIFMESIKQIFRKISNDNSFEICWWKVNWKGPTGGIFCFKCRSRNKVWSQRALVNNINTLTPGENSALAIKIIKIKDNSPIKLVPTCNLIIKLLKNPHITEYWITFQIGNSRISKNVFCVVYALLGKMGLYKTWLFLSSYSS